MVERFDYIELQLEPKLPKLQTPNPLDPNSSKVLLIAVGVWVNEWFAVLSEGWVKLVLVCRIYRKNLRGLILKANGLKRGHTVWFVTYCFEWFYRRHIEGLISLTKRWVSSLKFAWFMWEWGGIRMVYYFETIKLVQHISWIKRDH